MLSSINAVNFNNRCSVNPGVIPPMKRRENFISDNVSFSSAEKIESVLQEEFVPLYKRIIRFFDHNPDVKAIQESFGQGHKINISRQHLAQSDSIVCDVVHVQEVANPSVSYLVKDPVDVSGVRYVIKNSGKVRRQEIDGHADAKLKQIFTATPKPYLQNKSEARRVIKSMDAMLTNKLDELNELCRLGKIKTPEPLLSPSYVSAVKKLRAKNYQQPIQPEDQSKIKGFMSLFKKFLFG